MQLLLLVFSTLISLVAFGQDSEELNPSATITPPSQAALSATMYSIPGFRWNNVADYCEQYKECSKTGYALRNSRVEVLGFTQVNGTKNGHAEGIFFEVRAVTNLGVKRGWVHESYITPDIPVKQCSSSEFSEYLSDSQKVLEIALRDDDLVVPAIANSSKFSRGCRNFIDEYGNLGAFGRRLLEAIDTVEKEYKDTYNSSCFYNDIDVSSICPNFKDLTEPMKKKFWAYAFASIAEAESSCNPTGHNRNGTNDRADGLFQLEFSWDQRRTSGRDERFCRTEKGGTNTQDLRFQAECATSIMRDLQCVYPCYPKYQRYCLVTKGRKGTTKSGKRVYSESKAYEECLNQYEAVGKQWCASKRKSIHSDMYWHELQGPNMKISRLIKQFPGCN